MMKRVSSASLMGFLCTNALCVLAPAGTFAQQLATVGSRLSEYTAFAIAEIDDFTYPDTDAVIVRRVNGEVPDVILVRHGQVDPLLLAAAVRQLAGLRSLHGNVTAEPGVYRVKGETRPWARASEVVGWATRLGAATVGTLPGIGSVRHIILLMPNQGGRKRR